ncbi:MAG: L-lactate permease [Pseudomonadota bacterium]
MSALLAAAPLAVILVGMGVLGRSAIVAGAAGLALALFLTFLTLAPEASDAAALLIGVGAEALHSTVEILWIVLPALAIHEVQRNAGAIERIRDVLTSLTEDRRSQALLIAWFFGLFMEGAAGFGTPVALAAPLLTGLGYAPVRAVVMALLGHAAGVSFGAIGTPVLAQAAIAGVGGGEIAIRTVALHAVCGPILLLALARLADDAALSRTDVGRAGAAALCFFLPSLGLAWAAGPELPTLGGALIGATAFVALLRPRGTGALSVRQLSLDLGPYAVILAAVLLSRLIGPVRDALRSVSLGWSLDGGFAGTFEPLYHPGGVLLLGLTFGAVASGRGAAAPAALLAAGRRLAPVAAALLIMLTLSRLMVHSGMIEALSTAAAAVGPVWPMLAPLIGVLGTFVTGSATASNILFTELQASTAANLALPATPLLAAQSFGAAIGNVAAPHNIIAGSAAVGLAGREGEILARTAGPCVACCALGGATVMALLVWF